VRGLLKDEIETIQSIAPEAIKAQLQVALNSPDKSLEKKNLAISTLEDARRQVRDNPMSADKIRALLNLEKQVGREAMVAYLEGRLQQLEVKP
jgi:hypothetical protein